MSNPHDSTDTLAPPVQRASESVKRLGIGDQLALSSFWLAYNFHWGALLAIVLPSQIAVIVGEANKEFYNGLIPSLAACISLFATPLSGALSDRSLSRYGRRRPFMAVGTAVNIFFLLLLPFLGAGSSIWLFLLVLMGIQLGNNWSGGPYAGLIPDVVPEAQRGEASGYLALMTAIGFLLGAVIAGKLTGEGSYLPIALVCVGVLAFFLLLSLATIREEPLLVAPPAMRPMDFLRSFVLPWSEYRDFYFVLLTRGLVMMGISSVFQFFQYFLRDVIQVANPLDATGILIGIIIAAGIPTSYIAGKLSDRYGRKPLVYLSGGLMAVASLIFIINGFRPSLSFTHWIGALFGIGFGAYQAVDWALAIDVLPKGESAARDMGIWHIALVLPQILAPAVTGILLAIFKDKSLLLGYTVVFALTAVWFILGTVLVRYIRGAR